MPRRSVPQNTEPVRKVGPGSPPVERRWKKGQSGNPGGRPKGLSRLIREKTKDGETIYRDLEALAKNPDDPRIRLEATKLIAAYGYGTPGPAQVEWDEERVRALATSQGRDPDDAARTFRAIQGGKASA